MFGTFIKELRTRRQLTLRQFCQEHGHDPIGEVYVVGIDPGHRGRGLGRALTLAGLQHLRARGLDQALATLPPGTTATVRNSVSGPAETDRVRGCACVGAARDRGPGEPGPNWFAHAATRGLSG